MIVELAREQDFEAVNRLARQVAAHHAQWDPEIQTVEHPYPMDFFLECTHPESLYPNAIYGARLNDAVVGFMRFYLWQTNSAVTEKRTMLSIDDIGVEENLRHTGIGTGMMDALRVLAKDWECSDLCLYVDVPNESAISFYEKCGFKPRNIGMRMKL